MDSVRDDPIGPGFPIRKSADQRSLSSPRGLSQSATSFIASWRQGIHQMPFSHLSLQRNTPCTGTSPRMACAQQLAVVTQCHHSEHTPDNSRTDVHDPPDRAGAMARPTDKRAAETARARWTPDPLHHLKERDHGDQTPRPQHNLEYLQDRISAGNATPQHVDPTASPASRTSAARTPGQRPASRARRAKRRLSAKKQAQRGPRAAKGTQGARKPSPEGEAALERTNMVEPTGIEPVTSSLQSSRSPN